MPQNYQRQSFPETLYCILNDIKNEGTISWMDDGKGFCVHNPHTFTQNLLPQHTGQNIQFSSFRRQLNLYGFRMNKTSRIYYNGAFYRGCGNVALKSITIRRSGGSSSNSSRAAAAAAGNANDTNDVFLKDENTNGNLFKAWEGRYKMLLKYVKSHNGKLPVTGYTNEKDGFALGAWMRNQRTRYRKNKHDYYCNQPMTYNQAMTKPRAKKLEKIPNWTWECGDRHPKPPTIAMNTVPNISIDVKSLLRRKNYNESLDNT